MLENRANGAPGSIADVHSAPKARAGAYVFVGLGKQAAMASILATAYFLTAAVGARIVNPQCDVFGDYTSGSLVPLRGDHDFQNLAFSLG